MILIFLLLIIISAERKSSSVVIRDVQHIPNNEPMYVMSGMNEPLSQRKHSVSIIDLQDPPSTNEFRRPKRTTRSVSPANSFRYILPFHSKREEKNSNVEQTSLGNRQNVPITVTKSPMYDSDYL